MKIGFLLNIVLLLCFICSQVLIWLLDGTLVNSLVQLLDKQSTVFRRASTSSGPTMADTNKSGMTRRGVKAGRAAKKDGLRSGQGSLSSQAAM